MKELCITSSSCSVLLDPEGLYESREKHELFLNGERWGEEYRSVTSLFDLEPDTEYRLESVTENGELDRIAFRTKRETCLLNVRDFGAKGDGETEDTAMLQFTLSKTENATGYFTIYPHNFLTFKKIGGLRNTVSKGVVEIRKKVGGMFYLGFHLHGGVSLACLPSAGGKTCCERTTERSTVHATATS